MIGRSRIGFAGGIYLLAAHSVLSAQSADKSAMSVSLEEPKEPIKFEISNPYKYRTPYGEAGARKIIHRNAKSRISEKKMKAKRRMTNFSRRLNRK